MIIYGKCQGCKNLRIVTVKGGAQHCEECRPPDIVKKIYKGARRNTPKRTRQNANYLKLRREYLLKNSTCECLNCFKDSDQIHHKQGREGALLDDPNNFLAVFHSCHEWIELNPIQAKKKGYSITRL